MKKVIVGFLALGAFAFASQSNTGLTMNELKADAGTPRCEPNENWDCESGATGNIYIGYKPNSGPGEIEVLEESN